MSRQRVTDIVRAINMSEEVFGTFHNKWDDYCSPEWVASSMGITIQEATDVVTLVKPHIQGEILGLSDMTDEQCVLFVREIEEGFHSSLDGWDYNDRTVIELFVADILRIVGKEN